MKIENLLESATTPDGGAIQLTVTPAGGLPTMIEIPYGLIGNLMAAMSMAAGAAMKKHGAKPLPSAAEVAMFETKGTPRVGWDSNGVVIQFPTVGGFPVTVGLSAQAAATLQDRLGSALGTEKRQDS